MFKLLRAAAAATRRLADLERTIQEHGRALAQLRDDLDYLSQQHVRLRGTVTGGSRKKQSEGDGEPQPEQPSLAAINDMIRRGLRPPGR